MKDVCSFAGCSSRDTENYAVTRDHFGYHWFCDEHWKFITFLFNNLVPGCVREDWCKRNHAADYYADHLKYETVKYQGKHYDLCDTHLATYDEILGIAILPDFED